MEFKRNSLSFLCASLVFTCFAFTTNSAYDFSKSDRKSDKKNYNKINKKTKKNIHVLIISPTTLTSNHSGSLLPPSSLNCFITPLDFLPNFNFLVLKDTLAAKANTETTSTVSENEQTAILALLDEEANQKTNEKDNELDIEELDNIDFSSPNNLPVSPQLLERISIRENFTCSLVDIAVAQEGVPYIHGGKSPKGFDCSGFVSYVYSQFDINLPASSSSYDNVGKKVRLEDAQVGDVICFTGRNSRSGRTGHVGIIVENNPNEPIKFIHAASGSRRQITYSTMESGYYKVRFRSVRRISSPVLETENAE